MILDGTNIRMIDLSCNCIDDLTVVGLCGDWCYYGEYNRYFRYSVKIDLSANKISIKKQQSLKKRYPGIEWKF